MTLRPLGNRVLIKRDQAAASTKGGILLPEAAQDKPQEGTVIAVGPGTKNESGAIIAMDVQLNDRVLFGKWAGTEVTVNDETFVIVQETDILGVLS